MDKEQKNGWTEEDKNMMDQKKDGMFGQTKKLQDGTSQLKKRSQKQHTQIAMNTRRQDGARLRV